MQKKRFSKSISLVVLSCLFILSLSGSLMAQQNSLTRLSTAERSDGKGHVIRFHLKQPADSFEVYQPEVDLVQMALYSESVDTTDIELSGQTSIYDEINFYDIPGGIGVDIYISKNRHFQSDAYPDGPSKDILLSLARTKKSDLEKITRNLEPIIWSRLSVSADSLLANGSPENTNGEGTNGNYEVLKDKMKLDVIVIDPGHGGHDPGSIGYKGVKEKEIVLKIAKKLGGYINEYLPDVKVVYTREKDKFIELEERGGIANRAEGDLFISIHANSHTTRQAYGTDVFFLGLERSQTALEVMKRENRVVRADSRNEQKKLSQEELLVYEMTNSGYLATSERIAGMIEHQFDERAQRRSRGVKQARFVVLYHASMPAVLLETGFISNPSEARYLSSEYGQSIIASAIFRAVRNYKEDYEKSQHFNTK